MKIILQIQLIWVHSLPTVTLTCIAVAAKLVWIFAKFTCKSLKTILTYTYIKKNTLINKTLPTILITDEYSEELNFGCYNGCVQCATACEVFFMSKRYHTQLTDHLAINLSIKKIATTANHVSLRLTIISYMYIVDVRSVLLV